MKFLVDTRQLVPDVVGDVNEDRVEDRWRSSSRVRDGDAHGEKMARGLHVKPAGETNEVRGIPGGRGEATERCEHVVANKIYYLGKI